MKATIAGAILLLSGASAYNSWSPAGVGDKRSPCPALNTLANHGYVNHNGSRILQSDFANALVNVYQIDAALAEGFADAAFSLGVGYSDAAGNKYFDLDALDRHNVIEHDASLTREDFGDNGDNFTPQEYLIEQLKGLSEDGQSLGFSEMAKARKLRVSQESSCDPTYSLDETRETFAYFEAAFTVRVLGQGTSIPLDFVDSFFMYERIPNGWVAPSPGYNNAQLMDDVANLKNLTASF
eukprot:TRINITY_DN410_c0_g1_i2.p1 TRINITY_DN410_c0_g1~~TRINITY_DN410_c0_g1_i2.p1  ORF type:complete len:257 (+),score=66.23 TRINITY_DN410_c0_g1_i2:57-773(+)